MPAFRGLDLGWRGLRCLAANLLVQVELPRLGEGGPADLERLLSLFYVLFGLGFVVAVVAVVGHILRSRLLQITGISMVSAGTVLFMLAVGGRG